MAFEFKEYVTTDKAGFFVAGRRIPDDIKDGKIVPKVGHVLKLTLLEAKYPLQMGEIELKSEPKKSPKD